MHTNSESQVERQNRKKKEKNPSRASHVKLNVFLFVLFSFLPFFLIKNGNFRSRELEIYVLQITREHSVSMFVAESVGMNEWIKFTTNSKTATSFQMMNTFEKTFINEMRIHFTRSIR